MNAVYYESAYLVIVTLLTFIVSHQYASYSEERFKESWQIINPGAFFLTVGMVLFIGFRPISHVFVDMGGYALDWRVHEVDIFEFSWDKENFLYDNFYEWLKSLKVDIRIFFVTMSSFYFGFMYWACQKLFPRDTVYALLIILGAFSTFSYGTNGIKAGVAASIFLCALAYSKQILPCIIFLFLSLGCHHAMMLPVVAFGICYFYRNPRVFVAIWIVCVLLAALHITSFEEIFASLSDERGTGYLLNENPEFNSRFRPDFVFYSFLPALLGYLILFHTSYQSSTYKLIYSTYLLTNSVWMLCMYVQFNNRIAYLSWLMIPFVIIYPFFDKEFIPGQYKRSNEVAWCNLGFTLLMKIVYYGILGLGH